jgi:hypothetical protein
MPYGRGGVLAVLGEGMWQWQLHAAKDKQARAFYAQLWSNAVRWLALGSAFDPGESVALRISTDRIRQGEQVLVDVFQRELADAVTMKLRVIGPGVEQELALSAAGSTERKTAQFTPAQAGSFRFELETSADGRALPLQSRALTVFAEEAELTQTDAMPLQMATLAELSGGRVLAPDHPEQLQDALRRTARASATQAGTDFVWTRWWAMAGLLGLAGVDWLARKRGGLV